MVEITYQNGDATGLGGRGSVLQHASIDQEGTFLGNFRIVECYNVDDVCVTYMKHIYRLRSLILGGAPSFQGGPESRNTYSM